MEQFVVWKVLFKKMRGDISLDDLYGNIVSDLGIDLIFALTKCYLVTDRRGWNLEVQKRTRDHRYRGLAFD
jgi:hypothetical protein